VAWLERRLVELGGGHRPVQARISWRDIAYDPDTQQPLRVVADDRFVIVFGDGGRA
jgi:hypothetical protein